MQPMRGVRIAQTFRTHIGNAAPLRIGAADVGHVCQVDAETVGRAETGTLANEHHGHLCIEKLPDFIAEGNTSLRCDDDRGDVPGFEFAGNFLQDRNGMAHRRDWGEAVRDDEDDGGHFA